MSSIKRVLTYETHDILNTYCYGELVIVLFKLCRHISFSRLTVIASSYVSLWLSFVMFENNFFVVIGCSVEFV